MRLATLLTLIVGLGNDAFAEFLDEPLKPLPQLPAINAIRVDLGQKLFNETALSANHSVACASCHNLQKGGADSKPLSVGVEGKSLEVNTPTVLNASLNFRQFWNGRADSLETVVDESVRSPRQMGNSWVAVIAALSQDPTYRSAFNVAYPDGVNAANVQNALASYQQTLLTPDSRFDRYLKGDTDVLSQDEKYGYERFKAVGCVACHQGVNIGGNLYQKFGVMNDYFNDRGHPTDADLGRYLVTRDETDRNVFKVPSLRNVALTAPYFHDGSAATLDEAVTAMFKYQLGRTASEQDKRLIILFLKTLTGELAGQPL